MLFEYILHRSFQLSCLHPRIGVDVFEHFDGEFGKLLQCFARGQPKYHQKNGNQSSTPYSPYEIKYLARFFFTLFGIIKRDVISLIWDMLKYL